MTFHKPCHICGKHASHKIRISNMVLYYCSLCYRGDDKVEHLVTAGIAHKYNRNGRKERGMVIK